MNFFFDVTKSSIGTANIRDFPRLITLNVLYKEWICASGSLQQNLLQNTMYKISKLNLYFYYNKLKKI